MRLLSHFQTAGEGIGNYGQGIDISLVEDTHTSLFLRVVQRCLFRRGTDSPLWPFNDCLMAKETTVVFWFFLLFFLCATNGN